MSHRLPVLLAAVGATALLLGTGVWLTSAPEPAPVPEPQPTTLADYDTAAVALTRGPFCDLISAEGLTDALDGEPSESAVWGDGDRVPGVGPVHEYGCRFTGAGGAEAQAWVFAAPVTRDRARELVDLAAKAEGCERRGAAPAYGAPSVAVACSGPKQRVVHSHRGLFGDAWLTCTLTLPADVPAAQRWERTDAWCVTAAEAARS